LAGFNKDLTKKMLSQAGVDAVNHFGERFERVKYWLENYCPDKIYKPLAEFNESFYSTLTAEQKGALKRLQEFLAASRTEKAIQDFLYALINDQNASKKENQARQQTYFKIFYRMLFGRDDGPRLYLFLAASGKKTYLNLLAKLEKAKNEKKAVNYLELENSVCAVEHLRR
jgi:lysyl-tRNA synthetase class 1